MNVYELDKKDPDETRTTRTPAFWGYPLPPHDYPYHWVLLDPKSKEDKVKVTNLKNLLKFIIFEFWNKHYTRHTFWGCLLRSANMKWIRWVLLKIQRGHHSVHRRTDGQGETIIPPFQLRWSGEYNYQKSNYEAKNADGTISSHHYGDIIMNVMVSQITNVSIAYSTVSSDKDQGTHQSFASLAFVRGIHWWLVNSPH